jgi:hypothetical protein
VAGVASKLKDDVVSKAVTYLLGLSDWRPKLRLARLINGADLGIFPSFTHDLIQTQDDSGLFPLFWTEGQPGSFRHTALAIDIISDTNDDEERESRNSALDAILSRQGIDGSWTETSEVLGRLKRSQMHSGWSKELDRAEITSLILRSINDNRPEATEAVLKGKEWLQRFLKEQDYETTRSGDEYSLNPWTLDIVVEEALELGAEASKPSIAEAINVLSRGLGRAIRRNPRRGQVIWGLLAGTKTLKKMGDHQELLEEIAEEISHVQERDGSWRLGRASNGADSGEWTLQTLQFLTSLEQPLRRQGETALKATVELRNFVTSALLKNEDVTRQIFLTRFEEVGVRPNQPPEHLLFASFLYSILEQFYWVTSEFDPQSEYLKLILQIGRLERVGLAGYTDANTVRRALFRSQSLRDQASTRKGEVAHSISLFATFLEEGKFENFTEFVLSVRRFILQKAPSLVLGWKRDILLGELLRLEVKERTDPRSLVKSLEISMKCLPGVGEKVYSLFLYYVGHVLNVWDDVPLDFLEVPTDWNLVKPYSMLHFTSTPLEELKKRPQLAMGSIQQTAREMFREDPGKLYGLWVVGHEWCARPWMCRDRAGRYCVLYAQCPYPKSRR